MVSVFALMILLLLSSEYALKRFSESLLSETLETPVEIENVSIDLLEGTLSFHNTRIANLKGFTHPHGNPGYQVLGNVLERKTNSQTNNTSTGQ